MMTVRDALTELLIGSPTGHYVTVAEVRELVGREVSLNAVSKVARKMGLRAKYGPGGGYRFHPRAIASSYGHEDQRQQVPDGAPARPALAGGERSNT